MAALKGNTLLLKLGDGTLNETFTPVAGLRARSLAFNAKPVDVTASDSPGGWRELLAGAGPASMTVTGSGVFRNAAADAAVRTAFLGQIARNWQLYLPTVGVFAGAFLITSLDYAGQFDGEVTYALGLASAGQISFTAGN